MVTAMKSNPTRTPTLLTIPAKSDAEFEAGKRLYAEQWGDAVVTNTYLKITILALSLVCAGSLWIAYATVKKIDSFHTRSVLSGYKPNRFSWLRKSVRSDLESVHCRARKMGFFSNKVRLRTCRS